MLRPREHRPPDAQPGAALARGAGVAFSLGHPGLGPGRITAQLAQPMWGGLAISASGVYNVLRRHGLSTRGRRLSLVAGYAAPAEPEPPPRLAPGHLEASAPGQLVQIDGSSAASPAPRGRSDLGYAGAEYSKTHGPRQDPWATTPLNGAALPREDRR